MTVTSFANRTLSASMLAGQSGFLTGFEHIQSITVGSLGASSVTFSNIPQGYKHLQIRGVARTAYDGAYDALFMQFNGDASTANYVTHALNGDGASATSNYTATGTADSAARFANVADSTAGASIFGAGAPTYTLISETVLGSSASSVTFSSIPSTYKDLVVEIVGAYPGADVTTVCTFNGDNGSNYSYTNLIGNGSSSGSGRGTSTPYIVVSAPGNSSSELSADYLHIMSYSNTGIYKSTLGRSNRSSSLVRATAGLWRATAAISSVSFYHYGGVNIAAGSTFRLWGVIG